MDKLRIEVFIDAAHDLGDNDYVRGRISGMIHCMCTAFNEDGKRGYASRKFAAGRVITTLATVEEYVQLKVKLEQLYPGLCRVGIVEILDK